MFLANDSVALANEILLPESMIVDSVYVLADFLLVIPHIGFVPVPLRSENRLVDVSGTVFWKAGIH